MFIITAVLFILLFNLSLTSSEEFFCDTNSGFNCDCLNEPCLRRCCKLGEFFENGECIKRNDDWSPDLVRVKLYNDTNDGIEYKLSEINNIIYGVLPCRFDGVNVLDYSFSYFNLKTNGNLLIPDEEIVVDMTNYCSEFVGRNSNDVFVKRCYFDYETPESLYYTTFLIFISVPLLCLTLAVFLFVEGYSNGLASNVIISQISTLTVSYVFLINVRFNYLVNEEVMCIILGYLSHYSLLSNFFWLNIMCFDIWIVFSGYSLPDRNMTKSKERKKYCKYAIYSWGSPIIICIITFVADQYLPIESDFKPNIGVQSCILQDNYSRILLYFLPLTILLILNVAMFGMTAYKIFSHRKQMSVLQSDGSNINNNYREKERLNLYFKLFLIMGVTWIAEPLSIVFEEEPYWFWTTFDSINLLQGVPIFIIFVCKQRTIRAIRNSISKSSDSTTATTVESTNLSNLQRPSTTSMTNSISFTYSNSSAHRPSVQINTNLKNSNIDGE